MNPRRVVILSLTLLLAGAAGYGLLGLRAPKQAPAPAAPASGGGSANATIIAVGPDGTLYAIPAPSGASSARAYRGDDFRGDGYGGYEREGSGR